MNATTMSIVTLLMAVLSAVGAILPDDRPKDLGPAIRIYFPGYDLERFTIQGEMAGVAFGRVGPGGPASPWGYDAVWWDRSGVPAFLSPEPIDIDGTHWKPIGVESFDASTGDFWALVVALEDVDAWQTHALAAGGDPLPPIRYTTIRVPHPELTKSADFNGDGVVDIRDHVAYLNAWTSQREH